MEHQVPVFMSPSDRVAQLYPRPSGSIFIAFYESQGYGGGILNRLYTGKLIGAGLYRLSYAITHRSKKTF
jgi:hypothetical protein